MYVWDDPSQVPADWPASAVTIGVFDGVHRGHRELIRRAVDTATVGGMPAVVITFSPSPAEVVGLAEPPTRLSTLEQRLKLIAELGVDATLVIQFDKEWADLSAEQFAGSVLSDSLRASQVVVGTNFRFGHRARGNVRLLQGIGHSLGFQVQPVNLLAADGEGDPVSSTLIRELVSDGDVASAARMLARPHRVEGVVVRGDGRGAELGFPTANVNPTPRAAMPADGVYAGRIVLDPYGDERESLCAAISVGTNPTFDGNEHRVEAFAYDAGDLDLYEQYIAVDFVDFIRRQETYANPADLTKAVERDVDQARTVLGG